MATAAPTASVAPTAAAPAPPSGSGRAARRRWRAPIAGGVAGAALVASIWAGAPIAMITLALALPFATALAAVFRVDPIRCAAWVILGAVVVLAEPTPGVLQMAAGTIALGLAAAWLAWRNIRDPRRQLRLTLRDLQAGRLEDAHRAYGRFLMIGRNPGPAFWRRARAEITAVDAVRSRFSGMVNACRYGTHGTLGDQAFAALFPEAGASRASAQEG